MSKYLPCRIGLCALMLCAGFASRSRAAVTIKSLDETIQISLPDGWKEERVPPGTSEALEIVAMNQKLDSEVLVTVEEAGDTVLSLDDYMSQVLGNLTKKFPDLTHSDPKTTRINGKDAIRCEYKATVEGRKAGCVLTVVKVGTEFQMVTGLTSAENFTRLRSALGAYAEKVSQVPVPKGSDVVLTGKDGGVQFTFPMNWKQEPLPQNAGADMQMYVVNWKLNCGLYVESEARADTTETITENMQSILESFTKEYPGFTHTVPEPVKVGGHDGLRCEGQITAGGQPLSYIFTSVQTDTSYHQVYAFAPQEKFARLKPALIKAITTIKELKVVTPVDEVSIGKGTPFKGKDGTLKITLPHTWKAMEIKGGGGEIQLALQNPGQDSQLFVISESRDKVKDSLAKYTDQVIEMLNHTGEFSSPTHTDPENIQVNGQDATRFEFHAVSGGTKVAYLVTIVQWKKTFTRVQFLTSESKFKRFKENWEKYTDGLKEAKAGDDGSDATGD
jgi:hypothetical protein